MNRFNRDRGFTLLELLCALAVLSILVTLFVPLAGSYRARAQGFQCVAHLKGLGAGVAAYMSDHNDSWPQIIPADASGSNPSSGTPVETAADQWIRALSPYGIVEKTWRCPTIEARIQSNGTSQALKAMRLDYVPTQFDKEPRSAYQYPDHPWFIERTPSHGLGPKILQANGRVVSMEDLLKELPRR